MCVFCDLSAGSSHSEFNTAARCLREEDEISFKFMSQQNGNIKDLNIFLESLHLEIRRQRPKVAERLVFLLDSNTYADNTSKMVGGNANKNLDLSDYKFENKAEPANDKG